MRKHLALSILAATLIALSNGSALAKKGGQSGKAGMKSSHWVATSHGANKRGFCPPGQAKKPGRGSAFNC